MHWWFIWEFLVCLGSWCAFCFLKSESFCVVFVICFPALLIQVRSNSRTQSLLGRVVVMDFSSLLDCDTALEDSCPVVVLFGLFRHLFLKCWCIFKTCSLSLEVAAAFSFSFQRLYLWGGCWRGIAWWALLRPLLCVSLTLWRKIIETAKVNGPVAVRAFSCQSSSTIQRSVLKPACNRPL